MAKLDRDNAFFDYVAPKPTVNDSDAAEKARTAAMSQANAASRPATFLEQVEAQISKTTARLADLEAAQKVDIYGNRIIDPNSVEGRKAKVSADVAAVQAATPKPELTEQEIADGYIIKWIGTTNGKWQVIKPSAAVINATRKKLEEANWTGSGTTEDPKMYKGKPYTGSIGTADYVNGILQTSGGGNNNNNGKPAKTLISTSVDNKTGNTIGYFSDGSQEILSKGTGPIQSQQFQDAYALLEATFRDYGLESLVPTIKSYMERDLGPEQAALELRTSPEYIARFKGNQLRLAAGKNALREDIYLATERAYDETLTSYGQANYFGIDRQAKQAKMAQIIGNDISADEFKSRVDLAVARVSNADPTIKKLLKDFYPSLNDADLVGYFLNPAEGLPKLTEKVTSAEIGSAFLGQNLAYTQQRSTELAQYGVDRAEALKGAAEIAGVLPEATKLGDIYGETGIKYDQMAGEEEFLKASDAAKRKRTTLASKERASFEGSAGNAPGAYSTGYLKKSSAAGLI